MSKLICIDRYKAKRYIVHLFMPNTQSAISRAKKTRLRTSINKIRKGKYRSAIKQMSNYITAGKTKEAGNFLPKFHSQLMKIAKTGVVKKKTVSRKISRITQKIQNSKNKSIKS